MKKILIFLPKNMLKPVGGPNGYVYNLKIELENRGYTNFYYLPDTTKGKFQKWFNKLPQRYRQIYHDIHLFKECKYLLGDTQKCTNLNLNDYDAVHFHNTFALYKVKDSLKGFKGVILLTSHSPKPLHREWIEDLMSNKEYNQHKLFYDALEKIDAFAFDKSDVIIFPCFQAEEPYYNNWLDYKRIKSKNEKKYRYMLTGSRRPESNISKKQAREKYGITEEKFVICFIGRHNNTKGYHLLKEMGNKLLNSNKNILFLIAGKEEPLQGLKNKRWIEIGWTTEPYTILRASDVFVLPNMETYFDLVLLEALSMGSMILASRTGGNRYFEDIHTGGIQLFDSVEDAVDILEKLSKLTQSDILKLGKTNLELYEDKFTLTKFCDEYLKIIRTIPEILIKKDEQ